MFQGTFAQRRTALVPPHAGRDMEETVQGSSGSTALKVPGATDASNTTATVLQGPYPPLEGEGPPADWVVVLAKRPGTRRTIVEIKEIEAEMRKMFPAERVVVFNGSLTISEGTPLNTHASQQFPHCVYTT